MAGRRGTLQQVIGAQGAAVHSECIDNLLLSLRLQGLPVMMGAYSFWAAIVLLWSPHRSSRIAGWLRQVSYEVRSWLDSTGPPDHQRSSLCGIWMLTSALYPFLLRLVTAHQEHRFLLPILPAVHFVLAHVLLRTRDAAGVRRPTLGWPSIMLAVTMGFHLLLGIYLLQLHQVRDRPIRCN